MPGPPSYPFVQADQAIGLAGNGGFARVLGGYLVQVYASRKIEHERFACAYFCPEAKDRHS